MAFKTDNLQVDGSLITQQIYRADNSVAAITIDASNNVLFANDIYATVQYVDASLSNKQDPLVIGDFLTQDGSMVKLGGEATGVATLTNYSLLFDISNGFNNIVNSIALDSSGKIYVGGDFTTYKDVSQNILVKLNTNGTKDPSFYYLNLDDIAYNGTHNINDITIDTSGKIYVAGSFGIYDSSVSYNRLNFLIKIYNNKIDPTFTNIVDKFGNSIYVLALDSSGKLYVGGAFTDYRDTSTSGVISQNRLIRLNSDGTKDTTFDISSGFSSTVYSIVLDSSGKIYVGGQFTTYKGSSQNRLIRLNSDGTKDTTFDIGSGFDESLCRIYSIAVDSSGKIYVGGLFTTYQGSSQNRLIRLNSDGTKDETFDIGSGFGGSVRSIVLDSSGKIYVGGQFTTYKGLTQNRLIRLNSDGTKDETFDISNGFNNTVYSIVLDSSGKIYVGGQFTTYKGLTQKGLVKLDSTGAISLDNPTSVSIDKYGLSYAADYSSKNAANDRWIPDKAYVDASLNHKQDTLVIGDFLTKDGSIVKFGGSSINTTTLSSYLDAFDIGSGFNDWIFSITLDSSRKIYAGGAFTTYKGLTQNGLIRLNPDGTKDETFDIGSGFNEGCEIVSITLDSSGKIYVGGRFSTYRSLTQNGLIRLNPDGTKDETFDIGSGFDEIASLITLDSSGKIYVGGWFTTYKGLTQNGLIRLNSDGTKDTTFDIGSGFDNFVQSIALDSSGKLYVGGWFTTYKDVSQNGLIRLNPDGTKDETFDIGSGFDYYGSATVNSITLDSSGKIYAGGIFTTYKDVSQNGLIRLNPDGTKDETFDIGSGFNEGSDVRSIVLDSSGKIYAGGSITTYKDVSQNRLIRLNPDGTKDATFDIGSGFGDDVYLITLDSSGKIYAGGGFTTYKDVSQNRLIRLNPDGTKDKDNPTQIIIDDKGLSYGYDYSFINASNNRWIPDKAYMDNSFIKLDTSIISIPGSLNIDGSIYTDSSIGWSGIITGTPVLTIKNGLIIDVSII